MATTRRDATQTLALATPWIVTHTRRRVNPLALEPKDIHIRDIAHALARVDRFAGHADVLLSVAQHSVYVSALCPNARLYGLLHDGSEAYLGDVTRWLKQTPAFAEYRAAEARAQKVIYARFGLDPDLEPPEISAADKLMCRFEAEQGFHMGSGFFQREDYPELTPSEYGYVTRATRKLDGGDSFWKPWYWEYSMQCFLATFHVLHEQADQ